MPTPTYNAGLVTLPLDSIEIDADNVRVHYDEREISELEDALRAALAEGKEFINPPTVYQIGKDLYRAKCGNKRIMAAKRVTDHLHVLLVDPPKSNTEKVLDQMAENLLQGGLGPLDTAWALRKLRDRANLSLAEMAGVLEERGIHRSRDWVKTYLRLTELHPDVQQLVATGRLGPYLAFRLRDLPGPRQVEMAKRIVEEELNLQQLDGLLGRQDQAVDGAPASSAPLSDEERRLIPAFAGPESVQAELRQDIAAAASELEPRRQAPLLPPRVQDAEHRSGPVERRWELMPVPIQADGGANRQRLSQLNNEEWVSQATPMERSLAQEAVFLGGYSVQDAVALTKQLNHDATSASPLAISALNMLGQLLENPAALGRHPGLSTLFGIRAGRLLRILGANERDEATETSPMAAS